jgi:hypothetical protein
MPKPAQILFHTNFLYANGTYGEKLLVVMNTAETDMPCLVLKTTSVSERYVGSVQGCNVDKKVFFAPIRWQSCFLKDTYIQLPEIFEFAAGQLLKDSFARHISFLPQPLSTSCFEQLKNCLARFKSDISQGIGT